MTHYKTLSGILAGTIALGSCSHDNQHFHYKGIIGLEKIQFYELKSPKSKDTNVLEIVRPNGTKIVMKDFNDDFKVDEVTINKDGALVQYRRGPLGEKVIQEAQNQFDIYRKGIDDQSIEILNESTGETSTEPAKKGTLMPLE